LAPLVENVPVTAFGDAKFPPIDPLPTDPYVFSPQQNKKESFARMAHETYAPIEIALNWTLESTPPISVGVVW
jgi:hypothetical protein